jgi:hypothetical protein
MLSLSVPEALVSLVVGFREPELYSLSLPWGE